jgi:hypothetical protein
MLGMKVTHEIEWGRKDKREGRRREDRGNPGK